MAEKKLFLLDGHALIYRAHFAFITRPLINSKGMNTSAVTGFVRALWDIINNEKPTHLAVSFDTSKPTFRHIMYEEYKANREEQPEDITQAFPYVKRILKAFHIPIISLDGYEADDVIGTLSKQAEKEGFTVYMVTPDKDYAQLVSENIYLYKPSRQGNGVDILGVPEILEKWGIQRIDQVIDVLGLQGDSVDNIPGIPGIGPKTAVKLLAEYDSVEGIIENAGQLKGKQKERVETFADQAILSKKLATIDLDVPISFDASKYIIDPFDRDALSEIFKELEFRTLAKTILGEAPVQISQQGTLFGNAPTQEAGPPTIAKHDVATKHIENVKHDYTLVDSEEGIQKLYDLLSTQSVFCFDTETTGIDANQAELVGIAFSVKVHQGYYMPVPADQEKARALVHRFKSIFEDPNIGKIGQNIKYDILILKWYGVEVQGSLLDTMIMHYLLEPELRHNMDYLAETYLKYKPVSIETLIGKRGKNQLSMRDVPIEKVVPYAAEDADITLQLREYLQPKMEKEGLSKLYDELEAPLIKVIADMEFEGINLDADFLQSYSTILAKDIAAAEQKVYEQAGTRFNIASPKQVGEVLFDRLKIPYRWKKTKSGQYSTNEEKLAEMVKDHPVVEDILGFRMLSKLKSTYVDALPPMLNPKTGRIHSSFNQALAATGRLSSNNPNLQNIPIRTPQGRKVREAFVPRDSNHTLLASDYSQIELRLIAHISNDEAMLEAFQEGKDIHRATAARVYGVPYENVDASQRRNAKTVNFSIIYGAGATNLSRQLEINRKEARALIDQYFAQYQGLRRYMEEVVENARKTGYVTTLMGRRRQLRDINSRNRFIQSNAERVAINTPIQGSAADMIKVAMINIHKALKKGKYQTRMILQVHDELVFDVPKAELPVVQPIIEELMRTAIPGLKVPIVVESGTGANWLVAH